jgi:hypothetical protein
MKESSGPAATTSGGLGGGAGGDNKTTTTTDAPATTTTAIVYNQHYLLSKENQHLFQNIPMLMKYYQSIYRHYIQNNYLKITSQILLLLSNQSIHQLTIASTSSIYSLNSKDTTNTNIMNNSNINYANIPFHSLYGLLLLFIEFAPSFLSQNYQLLEDCFPYDIIHNGYFDISLGKYNFHENLPKFK